MYKSKLYSQEFFRWFFISWYFVGHCMLVFCAIQVNINKVVKHIVYHCIININVNIDIKHAVNDFFVFASLFGFRWGGERRRLSLLIMRLR